MNCLVQALVVKAGFEPGEFYATSDAFNLQFN